MAPVPPRSTTPARDRARCALVVAALLGLTAGVYWQVGDFRFVAFDDGRYVYDNAQVRQGLTWAGLRWAALTFHASNWHPLTWLAHMTDVQLFGLDAGWHHRVNVLWHGANSVLLFLVLGAMTGAPWRSALVAALFCAHPLHVESVAWVSERKDVLSTFFWLAATAAYVGWVRRGGRLRYLAIVGALALGLLAKPMVVTLPLALLLLDVWPLGRLRPATASARAAWPLVREKIPLLALSLASAAATLLAQSRGGTVSTIDHLPLDLRLANAALSYAGYLRRAAWPSGLAAFYPHPASAPGGFPWDAVAGATLVLAAITALVVWQRKRRPYLAVGWAWYLVTLVPVIGLVQVGAQAMADRYTYVPLVGVFVAVAWAIPDLSTWAPVWRGVAVGAGVLAISGLAVAARGQAATWRDTFTLFRHAAAVTEANWVAHKNLGVEHFRRGRYREAAQAFREALRGRGDDFDSWVNLAASHAALGEHGAVAAALEQALRVVPGDAAALRNLAFAYGHQGDTGRALAAVERLRRVDPAQAEEVARELRVTGPAAPGSAPSR